MIDKKFIQEKYHNYLSKIEQTTDGLLYTTDKNFAELFRVKDPSPVNFIKDPRARKYYEVHGKRSNLFTKVGSQYFLPWSVYNCKSRDIHPWAKENLYDRQYNAVQELLNFTTKWAILISWTGTGKTRCLAWTCYSIWKTVLLTPTDIISNNVVEEFTKFWLHAVKLNGKQKSLPDCDVLVMHISTFKLNYKDLISSWYRNICQDEWHHLSVPLLKLYNLWPWRIYLFTATPSRQEYLLDWFNIAMWKSVDTKITALPVIVRPITYTGKYTVEQAIKAHEWLSPDSYEYIRNLLYQDTTRIWIVNSLITKLLENGKNKIIVFSDRVDHAKAMYEKFQETQLAKSYLILWEVNDKASLIEEIKTQEQFVIFGTIWCTGEWMDVPMLEVGILTFNSKEERIIQQAVWRVRRKYWEKTCGIFFDIQDSIEIELSRKKYLGWSTRNKIYHSLWFDVKEPIWQWTIIWRYANSQTA